MQHFSTFVKKQGKKQPKKPHTSARSPHAVRTAVACGEKPLKNKVILPILYY
jgi:hypothetical protein